MAVGGCIRKSTEGEIDFIGLGDGSFIFRAWSGVSPQIINGVDGKFWNETWKNRAKEKGIEYDGYSSGLFSATLPANDYNSHVAFLFNSKELLKSHYNAAIKYNQEIAEPFIEERSDLIKKICE